MEGYHFRHPLRDNHKHARLANIEDVRTKNATGGGTGQIIGLKTSKEIGVAMGEGIIIHPGASEVSGSSMLNLSSELIDLILSFLSPSDLDRIGCTCHLLKEHSERDHLWQSQVQRNVPGLRIQTPNPFRTWRELYRSHEPHWFLTKHKVWFSDFGLTGKLVIVRYNPSNALFESYRILAEPTVVEYQNWDFDAEVQFRSFNPRLGLHKDIPIFEITPNHGIHDSQPPGQSRSESRNMAVRSVLPIKRIQYPGHPQFRTFELCRTPIQIYSSMKVWPPWIIPTPYRVRSESDSGFHATGHQPTKLANVSDQAFRIRNWMRRREFPAPNVVPREQSLAGSTSTVLMETVETYATLDPYLYTPTPEKPFKGIFVGDYSGHGCEFVLIHQPDDKTPFNAEDVAQQIDETEEEWQIRREEAKIYHGRIEAIKLTGDPNIFRGEYTFIADDIGEKGFVRIADDDQFRGARIVRSRGLTAEHGMRYEEFIESQLIIISPDKLAMYWTSFRHVNSYKRIELDQFLDPAKDETGELMEF